MSRSKSNDCDSILQTGQMIGRTFGRWTVIGTAERTACKKIRWLCRCSCGVEKVVYERYLLKGNSTSCGCFRKELLLEKNTTHGQAPRGKRSPEYNSWVSMRERCFNPNSEDWKNYGGRGIKVCDEWKDDFVRFFADMGPKPTTRHQIDRFPNNDGNYEPGNCRWATPKENTSNQRKTVFLEHEGKRLTQSEWSRITGIASATILERRRAGWSDEQVLTTPRQSGVKLK